MISKQKRFELLSFNFQDLTGEIWDNQEEKRINVSVYGLVDMLNDVSQLEFDVLKLRKEVVQKFDEIIGDAEWN